MLLKSCLVDYHFMSIKTSGGHRPANSRLRPNLTSWLVQAIRYE